MKSFVWLGLMLGLLAGHAGADPAPPNLNGFYVAQSNGTCVGILCQGVAVSQSNPLWVQWSSSPLPTGGSTSALQTAGNASLTTIATNSASQATAANQTAGNTSAATTATNTTTIATAQGAQGTGSTFNPPTGGSGILGYLSGIYKAVTGTLTVSGTVTTTSPATSTAVTPTAPTGAVLTLAAGGTPQNLANANACPNFIYIQNGQTTAEQGGIAAVETVYVNLTGNGASATPGGQSFAVYPGTTPIFVAQTTAIKWVAATTGHAINAWCE